MRRSATPELMDRPDADRGHLAESLRDLAWLNRYTGVTATVLYHARELLANGDIGRILDVGLGGGDILAAVRRWCAGRAIEVESVGLDRSAAGLRIAREWSRAADGGRERVRLVRGDAIALPFEDEGFDLAMCSTTLHHLSPDGAVAALRELSRVSRIGIVVTDLRRGAAGYGSAKLMAATVWRNHPYARHDGPASIRAAYTMREARDLARRAGLEGAVIVPHPGFRWALRWRRP